MGTTEVDEGCSDGTVWIYSLWVILRGHNEGLMLMVIAVVAVYGVLFLDWNSQGNPENPPFQGVRFRHMESCMRSLTCGRFGIGSLG